MPRHQRLKPVLEITRAQHDEAARQLAQVLRQHQAALQQLAQLRNYLSEYEQRSTDPGRSVDPSLMANQRAFLDKLKAGIAQQQLKVDQLERRVERCTQRWNASRMRADSLDKVIARYITDLERDREHRTQRELDDLAASRAHPTLD